TAALVAMAKGKTASDPKNPKARETHGKDGLFLVRAGAAPADRAAIDAELIEWTTMDLEARMTAGVSSERVLEAVGAPAGARLVEIIGDPQTSDPNRTTAVRILAK